MTLVGFCSAKGSPGVTTAALAVAAAWPRPAVLAELDAAGGDLPFRLTDTAGRYTLATRPGLLTWAAARLSGQTTVVWEHCQLVGGRLPVLAGLTAAEQAVGLVPLWPELAGELAAVAGHDVLADFGRIAPADPLLPVVAAAGHLVVVTSGRVEGLAHARDRIRTLLAHPAPPGSVGTGGPRRVALLVVASDRHGPRVIDAAVEVLRRAALPADVVGFVAVDPAGLAALLRADFSARATRSLLSRTAGQVAARLCMQMAEPPSTTTSARVPAQRTGAGGRGAAPSGGADRGGVDR